MDDPKKGKFLFYTDTHLDRVPPWDLFAFIRHLNKENPAGIFLTGDIADGSVLIHYLQMLAKSIKCPIYFVLGNHCYHWHSIDKQQERVRQLQAKYPNLIWMDEAGVMGLNEEVCVIGNGGWYDAEQGNPTYLHFTFDWFMISNFRRIPSMEQRIQHWREMADRSANDITHKLEQAIEQDFKSIFILTHFPPWKEATRDEGTLLEPFWLPYNANLRMGRAIEKVMSQHKKRNATVLCGHTHERQWIRVSRNINCQVGEAKLFGIRSQVIYV